MALVLPDGYGMATVKIRRESNIDYAINTWGYDATTETALANATTIKDFYELYVMPWVTSGWVLDSVKTVQRDGVTYTAGYKGSGEPGGKAVASDPPQVSFLVHKHSALPGRSGQGRVYVPGVSELKTDGSGGITSDLLSEAQTALNTGFTALTLTTLQILHRDPANPNDYDFAPPTPITSLTIDGMVATQRRRLR